MSVASGPTHDTNLAAVASAAEEAIVAIGFQAGNPNTRRHLNTLYYLTTCGIDLM